MPRAVKKSDVLSPPHFGRKTALAKQILDRLMNRHSIHARPDFFQRECLTGFDRLPKFSLCFAGASSQNRARHIAEVSGFGVARENIENDQRVGVKRAKTALVRIACLFAAGNKHAIDRKSTRLNSSHPSISYAVFCLKKKKKKKKKMKNKKINNKDQ